MAEVYNSYTKTINTTTLNIDGTTPPDISDKAEDYQNKT